MCILIGTIVAALTVVVAPSREAAACGFLSAAVMVQFISAIVGHIL